jgi:hypothetical protein
MVPFLDPDGMTESETTPETDPDLDVFIDSLVWEEADEEETPRQPRY